jgi:integrase
MKGHIRQRSEGTWTIVIDIGRKVDSHTGLSKRMQQWKTVRGTKKQAEAELTTMLHNLHRGQVVNPSKMILGEWLDEWLNSMVKPNRRFLTYVSYRGVVDNHLKPALGQYRLCEIRAAHLQAYYQASALKGSSLHLHHAILHSSLQAAVRQDMIPRNPASLVTGKPRAQRHIDVQLNRWNAEEARQFLTVVKGETPQVAAFYGLALDSGMRRAELSGLWWKDIDLDQRRVSVVRQLIKNGAEPVYGPPKNGQARTIDVDERTVDLLRRHKAAQAAHRLLLGTAYRDRGLVFTREFGQPMVGSAGWRQFHRLMEKAGVKQVTLHGLWHTCATLALQAGVPAKVVSERLGHRGIEITLNIYTHALPSMQQDAAVKLGKVLHG